MSSAQRGWSRRMLGVAAVGALALASVAATSGSAQAARSTLSLQILSFNDFHGSLQPPAGSGGRLVTGHSLPVDPRTGQPTDVTADVGGVEYLATRLKQARQGHPNSLTVAAGDLIGASPLLSAAFYDEPTIESMNSLGLDVAAVGNHEFDGGYQELQRMQNGGCIDDGAGQNNANSCALHTFQGATFQYLAANVKYAGTNKTILPAYTVKEVGGAKVGFIGMTLRDTPTIVTAAGVAGLKFQNEVKTANDLVPVLRRQGVKAIVVLIHQGGTPGPQSWQGSDGQTYQVPPSYDAACQNGSRLDPTSPILPIARRLDPEIDLVVSGHTHQSYVCDVKDPAGNDRMVTSASSFGRLFTETEMRYDLDRGDIVRSSVRSANQLVTRDVAADPGQTRLIAAYGAQVAPIASKVVGRVTCDVVRSTSPGGCPGANAAGESPLGDLIADGQLADPSVVLPGGPPPVVAFMNSGGIRADLTYAATTYPNEQPGDVTFGEAFAVQPFNNYLVSMDLTGQDIYDLLTQQVTGNNAGTSKKPLQVSKGFTYTMTPTGPVDGSVTLGGVAVDKSATYRVVANSFLSDGGDSFAAFTKGTNKVFGGLDIDAFGRYLGAVSPYTPAAPTRVGGTIS